MAFPAFAFCLPLALLPACGPRFTNANLEVINQEWEKGETAAGKGMREAGVSPKEAESILGPPRRVERTRLPLETQKKEVEVTRYYYEQDGETLELHFFDNKLIARVPHLRAGGQPAATPARTGERPAASPAAAGTIPAGENPANTAPLPDK